MTVERWLDDQIRQRRFNDAKQAFLNKKIGPQIEYYKSKRSEYEALGDDSSQARQKALNNI